jgi:hypothetical protein
VLSPPFSLLSKMNTKKSLVIMFESQAFPSLFHLPPYLNRWLNHGLKDVTLHTPSLAYFALIFTKEWSETIKYTTKNICQGFFREGDLNTALMDQASVRRTETTLETPGVSIVIP